MSVENLSHSLLAALRARYGEPDREVAEGVRTLSRLFTKERNALGSDYFADPALRDRKSTRLNSSHSQISYAVFCLKKKTETVRTTPMTYPLHYAVTSP